MMKKMKATKRGIVKYMIFVPTILFFTLMITAAGQNERTIHGKVFLESADLPAHGASVIIQGTTTGTIADNQGEFTLEVSGNPAIVFSYVGYETVRMDANKLKSKPVILIPTAAEIPLERINQATNASETEKAVSTKSVGINETEELFFVVEEIPSFPGGLSALGTYLHENLEYPSKATEKNMAGLAKVEFIVQANGSIDHVRIAESSNDIFNQAALDVIKNMPDWKPGSQRGKDVPCKVIVPVEFKLPQE